MINSKLDLRPVEKQISKIFSKASIDKAQAYALAKVAIAMRTDVIPNTPRGTGELMNSWRIEKQPDNSLIVGYDIIYAAYQERGMREDGTHVIVNRPAGGKTNFMQDTIDDNLQKYFDLFEKHFFKKLFG